MRGPRWFPAGFLVAGVGEDDGNDTEADGERISGARNSGEHGGVAMGWILGGNGVFENYYKTFILSFHKMHGKYEDYGNFFQVICVRNWKNERDSKTFSHDLVKASIHSS